MQEAISHLGTRLDALGVRNLGVFHRDALKPVHICDAFQDALEGKDYARQDKLLLYKMFGEQVITPLKELYDELNNFLIERGIMPKIEYHSNVGHRGGADYSTDSYDEPVDDGPEDMADAGDYMGGAPAGGGGGSAGRGGSGVRAGASGVSGRSMGAGSSGAGASGAAQAGPSGGLPAGASGTAASDSQQSGSGDQRMSAGYSAGHIQQAVQNFHGGASSPYR